MVDVAIAGQVRLSSGGLGPSPTVLALLVGVFFITSAVSMVTGSTSLITVPALLQAGVEPQVAIATNMAALTLMSVGATLPFMGQSKLDSLRAPGLIGLTLMGSALGAMLLQRLPTSALSPFIAASMLVVVGVSLTIGDRGLQPSPAQNSTLGIAIGYLAAFLLAIYGGLFSGGYVTLLTATFVGCFGHSFIEAIATSKLVNIFSSLVATLVFIYLGLVDFGLGLLLGVVMFLGAFLGGRVVLRLPNCWLRRIYVVTVIALALRLLLSS
ncbi:MULTISPECIES: sulfite exporter TauE/SafE family protein [Cyanophyceae]|uniref:Probable membrane transporter protein n=1 Tax=Leptolyngbya subtilissima DQ-A4 TaxID=2933933 RepID=A0ABV0KBE3_9CYAN|nr:sulfite exporter TauE/SafE family protein [Nodosilinea sp. FACHB-141]MBD2111874.1 sulfite exporter TauE/SafE family protein [Nodosilinea sp. FACHB-141]